MADFPTDWLRYYRASAADAARSCPNARTLKEAKAISADQAQQGFVPAEVRNWLFATQEKRTGLKRVETVPVLIFPRVFAPEHDHGQTLASWHGPFAPVCLFARMSSVGRLVPEKPAPWIPRDRLEPVVHDGPTLGELTAADKFCAECSLETGNWKDTWDYAEELIKAVAGIPLAELAFEGFVSVPDGLVCLAEEPADGINRALLQLYKLLLESELPPSALVGLLRTAGARAPSEAVLLSSAQTRAVTARHWGTVSAEFPLAPSQRRAMHHLLALEEGGVLAIQGPPGTGKTTLLKSVVAQLWVEAAVANRPCPLIAACSVNNQAVTNIIDAFANEKAVDADTWRRRWLPDVRSLGLFAMAASREAGDYQTLTVSGQGFDGFFQNLEQPAYAERAAGYFLGELTEATGSVAGTLDQARDQLQHLLRECTERITRLLGFHARISDTLGSANADSLAPAAAARTEALLTASQQAKRERAVAAANSRLIVHGMETWERYLGTEPWWLLIFGWLPAVKTRRDAGRRLVLRPFAFVLGECPDTEADTVNARWDAERAQAAAREKTSTSSAAKIAAELAEWKKTLADYRVLAGQLREEACVHPAAERLARQNEKNSGIWADEVLRADAVALGELLDVTWREKAFRLAMHFWEACYLVELREWLAQTERPGLMQPEERERTFRRWAKVAPCMVSTFFMLPKFFTPWPRRPQAMGGVIDLLITDEAGQVSPEKAVASFALARRALVVGDRLQIEPVWGVNHGVDAANATQQGLAPAEHAAAWREWQRPGRAAVSASAGSVMALAQQASAYTQFPELGGGLFLSEHRRCVPEIIRYCNEHVYARRLIPLRGSVPREQRLLPPLGFAHLSSAMEATGSGWRNPGEARVIAAWLALRKSDLEKHYNRPLAQIVAVITPLRAQKYALTEALGRKLGREHGVTVGTVHALQGAERPVVIFSPVYDGGHRGKCFFDAGPNLLNVAVSRAQDTFLVFGCLDHFHPSRPTPGGRLGRELFGVNGAEITDIPWAEAGGEPREVEQLQGVAQHDQALAAAVLAARQRIVIVSPFMTARGLEARGILPLLASKQPQVTMEVYVDHGFTQDTEERRRSFAEARQKLEAHGIAVKVSRPDQGIHGKTLAVDDTLLIEGSFNWFSAVAEGHRYCRYETSLAYRARGVEQMIAKTVDELRRRCDAQFSAR